MRIPTHALLVSLLALMVFALTAAGAGGLLGPLYLLVALAIGFRALLKSPTRDFISFTMLLWMFSPFVRRLVDWQSGRNDYSPVLLAPLAVTLLAFLAVPRHFPRDTARTALPFFIYLAIVLYGLLLGLANGRGFAAFYAAANWIAPVAFALLIIAKPGANPEVRATLTRAMIGGGVVMALYGVFQFVVAPPWDTAWMRASGMTSIGQPEPFAIRVFSTMNAPGAFSLPLGVALLLLFERLSARSIAAGAVMVMGLALSLVRSMWGGVALGIVLLMVFGNARVKFRVVVLVGLVALAAAPLLTRSEFFETISDRFSTLSSIEEDASLRDRREFANSMLENFGQLLVGQGLGSSGQATTLTKGSDTIAVFDNGWLDLVFTFGFVGLILAATLLSWAIQLVGRIRENPDSAAMAVIPLVQIIMLIFANGLYSPSGMFLFPFLACVLVETNRYSAQRAPVRSQHDEAAGGRRALKEETQ